MRGRITRCPSEPIRWQVRMPERMYPWLSPSLSSGSTIVTASRRLARKLLQTYAVQQLKSGCDTWHTPEIHFWSDWLNALIESADPSGPWPTRIDENSAAILWEQCLAKHSPDPLLSFASVVRQARQTWLRLQDWQVPLEQVSRAAANADQQQFAKAAWAYRDLLRSNNWVDSALVPPLVADALKSGIISPPDRVMFAGFDRFSPAVERILKQLRAAGCIVEFAPNDGRAAEIFAQAFADHQQELRAAGGWARQRLMRDPDASIAVIRPDLDIDALAAGRLIREGLAPGWQYAGEAGRNALNVSYGRRLAEFPGIAIALLVLRWIHSGLTTREVSVLLRSPMIVSDELSGRSRFELELRLWPDRSWTPASLAAVLRRKKASRDAVQWLQLLERIVAFRAEHRGYASPQHWAEILDRFLDDCGWPGSAPQESAEFQLLSRWRSLLADFAATGLVTPRVSVSVAIQRLQTMAAEVIFQPESSGDSVQLIGMLEASGMSFDAVWICGLESTRWPPPPNPLALVSRGLQRQYAMPDATPGDSLAFAELVLERIVTSARTVVLSWPMHDGESELGPSPLVASFPVQDPGVLGDPDWHAIELQDPGAIVNLEPDVAPQVLRGEKIAGGAFTVQAQTVDPFAAFARGRLGVKDIPRVESGLPARLRGSIAHQVLHAFFASKPDRQALAEWTEIEIETRSDRALSAVLASAGRHMNPVQRKLLDFERVRLRNILKKFVDAERLRPDFSIECLEEQIEFEQFGVCLELRVDRIDRLEDHTLLVIDYKTGMPKSLLNREGDLVDLQLAVYAIAIRDRIEGDVGGLALINIGSGAIGYKGTGGSVEWDAKRRPQWRERLTSWTQSVDVALRELTAGDVRVNVSRSEAQSRQLALLSRIGELRRGG
jgi:probable DNA repair protein